MYDFDLRRVRQTLDDGETVDADDVRTLADEVEVLRRRLREPTELHLTARIDPDHPGLWSIDHPLLVGTARAGSIPDALTLAAIDLRRALGTDDDDEQGVRRRVDRAEWEVLATSGGPTAEALAGAVRALELAEAERDEALAERDDHRWLRSGRSDRTGREQEEARRRVRERSLERLAAANVEGVDRRWADSGFGSASDHGLVLPALVVATSVRGDARDLRWRFDGGRRWVARRHRWRLLAARPLVGGCAHRWRTGRRGARRVGDRGRPGRPTVLVDARLAAAVAGRRPRPLSGQALEGSPAGSPVGAR